MPAKKRQKKKKNRSKKPISKKKAIKSGPKDKAQSAGSKVKSDKKVKRSANTEEKYKLPLNQIKKGLTKDIVFAGFSVLAILALKFTPWGKLLLAKIGLL